MFFFLQPGALFAQKCVPTKTEIHPIEDIFRVSSLVPGKLVVMFWFNTLLLYAYVVGILFYLGKVNELDRLDLNCCGLVFVSLS